MNVIPAASSEPSAVARVASADRTSDPARSRHRAGLAAGAGARRSVLAGAGGGDGPRSALGDELADRSGERPWLVAHYQRVAVGHLDEPRVGQQLGEPATVLRALHAILGRPHDERRSIKGAQALADLDHLAAAGAEDR